MQAQDYSQLQQDISAPPLSSYRHFFQIEDMVELYAYYCWNEAISAAFFRCIGIVEVTLRNSLHRELSRFCHNTQSSGVLLSNDWYNFLELNSKSAGSIQKITHYRAKSGRFHPRRPAVSHDDVISRLTYGFWPKLLDIDKTKSGSLLLWGNLIPLIIPNHRHNSRTYWLKTKHQDKLYARLELVGSLRNRIAHFEPIWKQKQLFEETRTRQNKKPKVVKNAPSNSVEARERLTLLHERIQELLGWLSKPRLQSYRHSYTYRQLSWLLSQEGFELYLKQQSQTQLSHTAFKRELSTIVKMQKAVRVLRNGKLSGVFYPIE